MICNPPATTTGQNNSVPVGKRLPGCSTLCTLSLARFLFGNMLTYGKTGSRLPCETLLHYRHPLQIPELSCGTFPLHNPQGHCLISCPVPLKISLSIIFEMLQKSTKWSGNIWTQTKNVNKYRYAKWKCAMSSFPFPPLPWLCFTKNFYVLFYVYLFF